MAFALPQALAIAAANVDAKRDAGKAGDDLVIRVDGALHRGHRFFTASAHRGDGWAIHVCCITWSIDADILATCLGELNDHLPLHCHNVLQECLSGGINRT